MVPHSLALTMALGLLTACRGGYDLSADTGARSLDTGQYPANGDTDPNDTAVPSEVEDDFLALTPAQTDQYVFIANPARDTLTRIDVLSQDVVTVSVGRGPAAVLAPNNDTAAVFNKIGDSVTLVDAHDLTTIELPVRDDLNHMVQSDNGEWLALWHHIAAETDDDPPPDGLQSFNEVSFIDVLDGQHHAMAVGFNPKDVQFTPDGRIAAIVSDESLAIVNLNQDVLIPTVIPVTDLLVDAPVAEEVVLAESGRWAYVRQFGTNHIVVVDLIDGSRFELPMGTNPTDMDLSPDGTMLAVVARAAEEIWVLDAENPTGVLPVVHQLPAGLGFGSLMFSPAGDRAVLYTSASLVDRYATWTLADDAIALRSLVKPVRTMSISPTGGNLLVFHTQGDAPDADTSSPFYGEWALTMINLLDGRNNPLLLPAEPVGYAHADSGDVGFFIMERQPWLEVLRYGPLLHDEVPLRSAPVWVGAMPDDLLGDGLEPPCWVSQEHELGRISFYDPDDAALETITGFELNAAIED